MIAPCSRRAFVTQTLGLVAVLSLSSFSATLPDRLSASVQSPLEDIYYWEFTGTIRCNDNHYVEELWCYYECAGGTCTPMQYEWRATGRPC